MWLGSEGTKATEESALLHKSLYKRNKNSFYRIQISLFIGLLYSKSSEVGKLKEKLLMYGCIRILERLN